MMKKGNFALATGTALSMNSMRILSLDIGLEVDNFLA